MRHSEQDNMRKPSKRLSPSFSHRNLHDGELYGQVLGVGPGPGAEPGLAGGKNDRTDLSFKCVPTVIILWMREGEKKYYPKERTYVSPYNRM